MSNSEALGSVPVQSVCNLWWEKWHWNRVFFKYFAFLVSIIPPILDIDISLETTFMRRKSGRSAGNLKKACPFGYQGAVERNVLSKMSAFKDSFGL